MNTATSEMAGTALSGDMPDNVIAVSDRALDLQVRGLSKRFGDKTIFNGLDISVGRGESVALLGANGSGKSTFLRCCLRLVEPDAGSISLLGEDPFTLRRRDLRALRAQVGFVFQRHQLVPRLSVLSNVIHGCHGRHAGPRYWLQGLAPQAVREEAMHCLEMVGLSHLASQRADTLSGGQSQRVAIARALMQRPVFVVADEPVASLDPTAGEEVMQMFVELMRQHNITLLFTSHHLDHAMRFADRIIGLRHGRVALDAGTHSQNTDDLRQLYG